jgi:hypothetical protein
MSSMEQLQLAIFLCFPAVKIQLLLLLKLGRFMQKFSGSAMRCTVIWTSLYHFIGNRWCEAAEALSMHWSSSSAGLRIKLQTRRRHCCNTRMLLLLLSPYAYPTQMNFSTKVSCCLSISVLAQKWSRDFPMMKSATTMTTQGGQERIPTVCRKLNKG